jgi:ubiquinone/menaquinone biosynthesis C-methylase UbiE
MEGVIPASSYVPWFDTDPSFVVHNALMRRRIADLKPAPLEVLDAGCGSGTLLYNLTRWYPDARVTGLDASSDTVERLGKVVPLARVVVGNVLNMPISSGAIDFVTATQVIEHVPEEPFLTELRRILKPGGKAFISSVVRLPGAFFLYQNEKGEALLEPTHLREYPSGDAFEGLLRKHGFNVEYSAQAPVRFSLLDFIARRAGGSEKASRGWRLALRKASMLRIPKYLYCECFAIPA